MKERVIVLGIVGVLSFSTFVQAKPLSKSDMEFLFGSQPVQAKTISVEEMKNTEGKWGWWGAFAGGLGGAVGYIGYAISTWSWNWGSFAESIAWGAGAGFVAPSPIGVYEAVTTGFAGGVTAGVVHDIISWW